MGTPSTASEFVITLKGLIRNNIVSYIFENNFSHAHVYKIIRLICEYDRNIYLKGGLVLQVALDKLIANSRRPASCEREIEEHGALGDIDMGIKGNNIHWTNLYERFAGVRKDVARILDTVEYYRGVRIPIRENIWHIMLLKLYRGYSRDRELWRAFNLLGLNPDMGVADIDEAIATMRRMIRIDSVEHRWIAMEDKHCDVQRIMVDPNYEGEIIEHIQRRYAISAIEGINGNNGIFDLMRMGPVLVIEIDMAIRGAHFTLWNRFLLPFFDLSHNVTLSPDIDQVPVKYVEENGIRYQEVGNYLMADLKRMLFQETKYPWLTGKYEKRLRRYIIYGALYPIIKQGSGGLRDAYATYQSLYTVVRLVQDAPSLREARLDDYQSEAMRDNDIYYTTYDLWRYVAGVRNEETIRSFMEYVKVIDESLHYVSLMLSRCFNYDISPRYH